MPPNDSEDTNLPLLQAQAIEWLVRLRTHELSEIETREFADWLSQDLSHSEAFANAEALFGVMSDAVQLKTEQVKPHLNAMQVKVQTVPRKKRRPFRWLAVPLALAASWLFTVNLILPEKTSLWDAYFSDYQTGTGEQRSIQLADGSQILMNTNTALSVNMNESARHITLHQGQAQFTVAVDKARPFTVSVGDLQVRALGTVFEIYRTASDEVDVSVLEHTVAISLGADGNPPQNPPVLVQQGQQLRYNGSTLTLPTATDSEVSGAWRQRRVIVRDRPLAELVAEIERYRQGRVFLGGANLKTLRVTGLFSLNDPEAALTKVRKILGLKESRLGPWWVLLHR